MARVARACDLFVGRFLVHDRLAGREHAAVERLEVWCEVRDHLGERPADVRFRRLAVQLRERVVDTDEAQLAIPEADSDRSRDEERVELRVGVARGTEEKRVLDRERGAPADLARQLEVDRAEPPSRLAGAERDRPEQQSARLERDDDVRGRVEGPVEGEMLLVDRGASERRVACILDQVRLARAEHLGDGVGLVLLGRVALAERAQELLPLGIPVRDHDLTQAAALLLDHVDDAVVGEPRDEQRGELRERRRVVEPGGEERARLGEEADLLLGVPLLGDVVEDGDHEPDLAGVVQGRRRADDRPALFAGRQDPVADDGFLGLPLLQRPAARELLDRERAPVLADELEALDQLGAAQAQHLLRRREPAQLRSGVVGVDEPPVGRLRGDPVRDVAQDRGQLVRSEREQRTCGANGTAPVRQRSGIAAPSQNHFIRGARPRSGRFRGLCAFRILHSQNPEPAPARMGREGIEPSTLGLRVPCSTS